MRKTEIKRTTGETDISVVLDIDGTGSSEINSGCGFFDHMLTLFAKHGHFDLKIICKGDTHVDYHHTVEDIGITLGKAGICVGPLARFALASLLAARLDLNLVDASCGGATSEHVLRGWSELPPQIDALDRETRLVTITVGGNDLGYVGWLFASSCRLGVAAFPGPCRPAAEPTDADYARLDRNLRAIAQQVRVRAPQARLVFVQYVTLLSDTACGLETVTPADAAVARRIAQRLASVTDGAARASGADVLDADRLSRSHTPCSPEPWSNGLSPGYNRTQGAPWHPNAAGHAAIARELASLLQARPALNRK